jgi:uncharacterized Zn finger protein
MDKFKLQKGKSKTDSPMEYWQKVECSQCDSTEFEVIITDLYETSVRCLKCGEMDIVHEG